MMIAKKGPLQRRSFPRGALWTFKQHSWFTAFHHAVFGYFLNFLYHLTGSAMQMQVICFLWSSDLIVFVFVSHSWEERLLSKCTIWALVSWILDVFMYSHCPSGHHKGATDD